MVAVACAWVGCSVSGGWLLLLESSPFLRAVEKVYIESGVAMAARYRGIGGWRGARGARLSLSVVGRGLLAGVGPVGWFHMSLVWELAKEGR